MKVKSILTLCLIVVSKLVFSQTPVDIKLKDTPFSYKGAYMVLAEGENSAGETKLYLRDISGNKMWQENTVFLLEPTVNGKIQKVSIAATSSKLTATCATGTLEFCFEDSNIIRVRGTNVGLKVTQIAKDQSNLIMPVKPGQWRVQQGGNAHYVYTTLRGDSHQSGERYTLNSDGKNQQMQGEVFITTDPKSSNTFESVIEQYPYGWALKEYTIPFDQCVKNADASLADWISKTPAVSDKYKQANKIASYQNWSCVVAKRGFITREIIYVSKNTMRATWAWDHCFTSMALAYHNPNEAWDNLMIMFDYQNETGSFPDFLNERQALWGFVKPPIHGWTFRKMMESNPKFATPAYLNKIYVPLQNWTHFWFNYHDDDKDGLPEYHHGNDAGWDNASNFDLGFQAESPDLSAYLALQMDVIAEIATKLDKPVEAEYWKKRSQKQVELLIANFWTGKKFVTKRMDDDSVYDGSGSLMGFLPLVLGKLLPKNITDIMIADLKTNGQFTSVGLASENPNSKLYTSDSYWRGPVWAPPTLIISSGVYDSGDKEFAKEIARRFCDNCVKNGFAENYNALTGEGLRDRSLTWTSSVFQILAHEYLNDKK